MKKIIHVTAKSRHGKVAKVWTETWDDDDPKGQVEIAQRQADYLKAGYKIETHCLAIRP